LANLRITGGAAVGVGERSAICAGRAWLENSKRRRAVLERAVFSSLLLYLLLMASKDYSVPL